MAMSHANCTHPRTPAGRAACRKLGVHLDTVAAPAVTPAIKMTGDVARRIARQAVKADNARPANNTKPKLSAKNMEKNGTRIKSEADLGNMPRMLAHGVRIAWKLGISVTIGPVFREDERIIVAHGSHAMVYLTWRAGTEIFAVSTKPNDTSVWTRRMTIEGAFRIAMGADAE